MKFIKLVITSFIVFWSSAHAAQSIEVVWGFNLSGITSNHIRFIVDEANRVQSDYKFIFTAKPGAGGAISTNYVTNANSPAILAISTSYFIRPNLFTNNAYDMSLFKPLVGICNTTSVVYSKKYTSFKEIPLDAKINIAVTGLGANTHLTALEIQKKYKNANIVPYQGSIQAIIDAAAGRLDMGVAFIGDIRQHVESGTLNSIGVGGNKTVFNTPTLKSQGIDGAEGVMQSFFLLSNSHVSSEMHEKFREIFLKARQGTQLQNNFALDFCTEFDVSDNWYKQQQQYWKSITKDVKVTE